MHPIFTSPSMSNLDHHAAAAAAAQAAAAASTWNTELTRQWRERINGQTQVPASTVTQHQPPVPVSVSVPASPAPPTPQTSMHMSMPIPMQMQLPPSMFTGYTYGYPNPYVGVPMTPITPMTPVPMTPITPMLEDTLHHMGYSSLQQHTLHMQAQAQAQQQAQFRLASGSPPPLHPPARVVTQPTPAAASSSSSSSSIRVTHVNPARQHNTSGSGLGASSDSASAPVPAPAPAPATATWNSHHTDHEASTPRGIKRKRQDKYTSQDATNSTTNTNTAGTNNVATVTTTTTATRARPTYTSTTTAATATFTVPFRRGRGRVSGSASASASTSRSASSESDVDHDADVDADADTAADASRMRHRASDSARRAKHSAAFQQLVAFATRYAHGKTDKATVLATTAKLMTQLEDQVSELTLALEELRQQNARPVTTASDSASTSATPTTANPSSNSRDASSSTSHPPSPSPSPSPFSSRTSSGLVLWSRPASSAASLSPRHQSHAQLVHKLRSKYCVSSVGVSPSCSSSVLPLSTLTSPLSSLTDHLMDTPDSNEAATATKTTIAIRSQIFTNAAVGMWCCDTNTGQLNDINQHVLSRMGVSRDALLKRRLVAEAPYLPWLQGQQPTQIADKMDSLYFVDGAAAADSGTGAGAVGPLYPYSETLMAYCQLLQKQTQVVKVRRREFLASGHYLEGDGCVWLVCDPDTGEPKYFQGAFADSDIIHLIDLHTESGRNQVRTLTQHTGVPISDMEKWIAITMQQQMQQQMQVQLHKHTHMQQPHIQAHHSQSQPSTPHSHSQSQSQSQSQSSSLSPSPSQSQSCLQAPNPAPDMDVDVDDELEIDLDHDDSSRSPSSSQAPLSHTSSPQLPLESIHHIHMGDGDIHTSLHAQDHAHVHHSHIHNNNTKLDPTRRHQLQQLLQAHVKGQM